MLYSLVFAAVIVVAVFAASLLVERLFGRSRKEFSKPGWFVLFYVLFIPGCALVYALVSTDSRFLYAAYALAGGIAALVAQGVFGVKLSGTSRKNDNA
jgi:hypothetical protein